MVSLRSPLNISQSIVNFRLAIILQVLLSDPTTFRHLMYLTLFSVIPKKIQMLLIGLLTQFLFSYKPFELFNLPNHTNLVLLILRFSHEKLPNISIVP